ncbi:MAG TPA: sorbosone dehydrogenase family protein [Thermoanaerobaculia bacterium]|nr:sorbosone dehydrogenase family protein [Thermoanaerobaculia bacterium]
MISKRFILIVFLLIRCGADAQSPPPPQRAGAHHDVRPDPLAKPYATRSAGNPSSIIKRPANAQLQLPPGFHIAVYAEGFDEPRNMALAPNGDVFVAETAGGRISIVRGTHRYIYASGLDGPFGLAFRSGFLYVGEESAVIRFPYAPGDTGARGKAQHIATLPSGGHSTRNVIFSRDGSKLYVAVGSEDNVNIERDPIRAAITEMRPDGSASRVFASGLRNPVGLALEPTSGALWTTVNERDSLGDELVPDYVTDVRDGAFYGWPYTYIGLHQDPRLGKRPDLAPKTVVPSLLIESHSAPLGLTFYTGTMFPPEYRGNAFVALHGSWNRSTLTGYKVISVPMRNGRPAGGYDDFVVGWIADPRGKVWGRPVGLLVLPDGSLLISDDGGDLIWRVSYSK